MTYSGGCHCKNVRFSVELALGPVIECNCSHCEAKGLLLAFVPATAFTLEDGAEALTEYRFNTEKIQHLFCSTCGVQAFGRARNAEGIDTVAINVRCLDGIDLATLERMPFDGKKL